MWEVEGNYQPTIRGKVGRLRSRAIHNDYKTLYHFFQRHNRYSDLEAYHRLHLEGISESYPTFRRVLKRLLRKTPGAGILFFLYCYVFRLGFLDGTPGLAFALARLCYFLQVECKVLEITTVPEVIEEHYLRTNAQSTQAVGSREDSADSRTEDDPERGDEALSSTAPVEIQHST
jgi:hypothetical protein